MSDTFALPFSGRLLTHRPFQLFMTSRALSSMGFQGAGVAIGWLVYDWTRNPFDLGLIGLFQFLPMVVLTFVAGHVADRFDRRLVGMACQAIEAVTMAVIAIGLWQGWLGVTGIFVAVAVLGSAQAFERPTMASVLPGIVPAAMLPSAIANSTSIMQTAMIIGPALAGLLYGVNALVPFTLSAVMFLVASLSVLALPRPTAVRGREPVTLKSVFAGATFIWERPVMLGIISLDLFAVLLGGATALLPVFARDILMAGPVGLGFLRTAPALGAIATSLIIGRYPLRRGVGRKMFWAVGIFGVATIVFALSTNIVLSVVALLVLGASDTVSVVIRSSLVQLLTPDDKRGRVNAINALFIGTSNQLGEFESGTLAGFIGPVAAVALGGIGTIAVVLLWMRIFPQLSKVETLSG